MRVCMISDLPWCLDFAFLISRPSTSCIVLLFASSLQKFLSSLAFRCLDSSLQYRSCLFEYFLQFGFVFGLEMHFRDPEFLSC